MKHKKTIFAVILSVLPRRMLSACFSCQRRSAAVAKSIFSHNALFGNAVFRLLQKIGDCSSSVNAILPLPPPWLLAPEPGKLAPPGGDDVRRLATNSDRFNLNFHAPSADGQLPRRNAPEGGVVLGEEGFVGGVDGREIVQVFHEYGRFHNVAYFQASGFHDSFNVFQRLTCLSGYVFRYGTGFGSTGIRPEVITMLPVSTPCTWRGRLSRWCIFRRNSFAWRFLLNYSGSLECSPLIIGSRSHITNLKISCQHHIMRKTFHSICI